MIEIPTSVLTPHDWLFLSLQGVFTGTLSFALLAAAPAYLPAPEVSLYVLLETVLAPILVFVGGFEHPPVMTIYGGIIIICALVVNG